MLSITMRMTSAAYYFKYVVNRPELLATFMPAYLLAAAAGTACTPLLTRVFDKRKLMIGLMLISTVLSAAFLFVPSDNIVAMYVLQIPFGLALGPKSPLNFRCWPIRPTSTSGAMAARHGHDLRCQLLRAEAGHRWCGWP